MLVMAAFQLTGVPASHRDLMGRAQAYVDRAGGIRGLRRRYGRDRTFAVPILTNCALAEMVSWREVNPLPFELACFPQAWYRFLQLPVVSYAIPALVAVGQARFHHRPPWNPLWQAVRRMAIGSSLQVLQRMQPPSGGYLEAIPLTSFVVMSLASTGRLNDPVVCRGMKFIQDTVRPDGSWPIDTNLATWNTTLATQALCADGQTDPDEVASLDWLLECQHSQVHAFTAAAPGGWAWTDLSGGVPDADDTSGALLALRGWYELDGLAPEKRRRIERHVRRGLRWLWQLQNRDGGWPTFCRGWGKLPFDRSGTDLTAHAIRALSVWRDLVDPVASDLAIARGLDYLRREQRADGSWIPLWFGNQWRPDEENPVYGTARVLLAYRDLRQLDTQEARRGVLWLLGNQLSDGSWGPPPRSSRSAAQVPGSVEETSLALEALLAALPEPTVHNAVERGLSWLVRAIERGEHRQASPIGFYFAKLWYHEKLYPLTFAVSALARAQVARVPTSAPQPHPASLPF
jgi:squalene-hopene/tetraprenyl-beta-curcumene cyclase